MYQTQSIQKKILLSLPPHLSFSKQKKKKRILLEEPLRRFQGFNIRGVNQIHPDAKLIFFHLPPFHLPFPSNLPSPLHSSPLPIRDIADSRRIFVQEEATINARTVEKGARIAAAGSHKCGEEEGNRGVSLLKIYTNRPPVHSVGR